jgi:lipoprotein-anchoring transpeptidase ErfK/SrfK
MHDLPRFIAPGEKKFIFSPRLRMWAAYDAGGKRVAYGIANGGSHYCGDLGRACRTPIGSFRVHSKGGPECVSSRFPLPHGGAAMPYCMHFRGGYAIHGSPQISNVNGSHGCVRVKTEAARWLSSNFMQHGTKVVVLPY